MLCMLTLIDRRTRKTDNRAVSRTGERLPICRVPLCRCFARLCGLLACGTLLLLSAAPATAQARQPHDPQPRYEITSIRYHITGRTREFALRSVLDLEHGLTFGSLEELEEFLADQNQLLINERALAESRVEYAVLDRSARPAPVRVDVYTVDSWNIIAVPFLRYNSDDGLLLSLRARDYNAFGTLERVAFDVDWDAEYPDRGIFETDRLDVIARWTLPFEWRGYEWRWSLSGAMALIDDADNQYSVRSTLGVRFPWLFGLDWTVSYLQGVEIRGRDAVDPYWLTSGVGIATSVATPWHLPTIGGIDYEPELSLRQPYSTNRLTAPRRGAEVELEHQLVAGRVNWIGNFRDGKLASLSNANVVNLYRTFDGGELNAVGSIIEAELRGYGAYLPESRVPMGVSGRIGAFVQPASLSGQPRAISTRVRGVRRRVDGVEQLRGEYGGYANVDAAARVVRVRELFEGHLGVFLDIGGAKEFDGGAFKPDDLQFGAGIEVLAFPLFTRALYMRASLGFDLRAAIEDETARSGRRELFIGIDHHY